jgi:hypothetical protein
MCTCASCSYTDKYAGKGFAEWPRGKPAGRSSVREYSAHVRYSQQWGKGHGKPECGKVARAAGTRSEDPHAKYKWPQYAEDMTTAAYVAVFLRDNHLAPEMKRAESPRPSPARPSKSAQHFPELDRQPEAVPSVSKAYRVAYSANDIEELKMRFMSVAQASKEWDISQPRIRQWLADGRVNGAQKVGRDWLIPASAIRPKAAKPGELMAARA